MRPIRRTDVLWRRPIWCPSRRPSLRPDNHHQNHAIISSHTMIDQDLHDKISRLVRIHACVCQFPKCAIQHLPVELIVKILNGLSTKESVLWQGVSHIPVFLVMELMDF